MMFNNYPTLPIALTQVTLKGTDMNHKNHRWIVLFAGCLINLCIGSLYSWSVFSAPLASQLALPVSSLAIVFTIATSVGPITMISGGFVNDKLGPKWVLLAGGLFFGAGMIATGFISSLNMLIMTYGLVCGLSIGLMYGTTVANSVKYFPDKKGLAGGITTASYGGSSVLVSPIAARLIESYGVSQSFMILGIIMCIIICASTFCIVIFSKNISLSNDSSATVSSSTQTAKDWKGMLSDTRFYVMFLILLCGAFCGLMLISQASNVAQFMFGVSAATASLIVSTVAFMNTSGRIISGYLSDKLGIITTLRGVFILAAIGTVCVYLSTGIMPLFVIGICCIGFAFGSILAIYPGFTAAQFGSKNNSVNYGIMFTGFAAAAYFGPTIIASIFTAQGVYAYAFLVAAGFATTGFLFTFVFKILADKALRKGDH